jgi:mono/diheme cytochrome c family protein
MHSRPPSRWPSALSPFHSVYDGDDLALHFTFGPRYSMKMSKICLALFLCPPALLAAPSAQTGNKNGLLEGQKTFQDSCSMCHGPDGKGGIGPSLRGKLKHGSDRTSVQNVIKNGVPGTSMPAMKGMPSSSLSHVTAYVLSLQKLGK